MLSSRLCLLYIAIGYCHGFTSNSDYRLSALRAVQSKRILWRGQNASRTSSRTSISASSESVATNLEQVGWTTTGYRRPLHWVQKVSHLEDTLAFYEKNFDFGVYRHEEFSSGCEATCNGPYGGAWSKTMVGPEPGEGESFCLELVYNYGVNKYERGNDLRSIDIDFSSFCGSTSLIGEDPQGRKFIETPDGHWLHLVEDRAKNDANVTDVRSCISAVQIHVSDLASSARFYEDVFGANVEMNSDGTATCNWNTPTTTVTSKENSQTSVVLVQLAEGSSLDFLASQGRFAIETEDGAQEEIAVRAKSAQESGAGRIVHGPVALEPHGENVLILRDLDGHEYCFVDARGFQRCIDVNKKQNFVDWDFRKNVHKKAETDYTGGKGFGESVTVVEADTYEELVATTDKDVLFDLYAPWCILCARNKPVYEEVAMRISEISGKEIVFAVFDGSKTPASLIENAQLGMMMSWAKTQGFPALFYLRGDDKDIPIEFDGEWTVRGLSDWVATHSSSPLDLSKMDYTELPEFVFDGDDVADESRTKLMARLAAAAAADDDDDCGNCSL